MTITFLVILQRCWAFGQCREEVSLWALVGEEWAVELVGRGRASDKAALVSCNSHTPVERGAVAWLCLHLYEVSTGSAAAGADWICFP